jgi:hypothetical protein
MTRRVGQLEVSDDRAGVPGEATRSIEATREAVFGQVRTDDLGRYRPLSGARTLRTGWSVAIGSGLRAEDVIEVVYPLALTHRRQFAKGSLRVVALDEVLARQSGRYESTSALSKAGRALTVSTVCGECVRQPVWDGATCSAEEIPCPEPCSVLVAFCRETTLWEAERPDSTAPDAAIAWAAFDEPGNELRERFLQELAQQDD